MDEDQLLDYEEEQDETNDTTKTENGAPNEKKIKVVISYLQLLKYKISVPSASFYIL